MNNEIGVVIILVIQVVIICIDGPATAGHTSRGVFMDKGNPGAMSGAGGSPHPTQRWPQLGGGTHHAAPPQHHQQQQGEYTSMVKYRLRHWGTKREKDRYTDRCRWKDTEIYSRYIAYKQRQVESVIFAATQCAYRVIWKWVLKGRMNLYSS